MMVAAEPNARCDPEPEARHRPRSRPRPRSCSACSALRAYLMIECLVYIGVVAVLLGVGYAAMYRCVENSVALRRNADDIVAALHAGELWRADVRSAPGPVRLENNPDEQVLHLQSATRQVAYRFSANTVFRRIGVGPWAPLLRNLKASSMVSDPRQHVTPCRWEPECQA